MSSRAHHVAEALDSESLSRAILLHYLPRLDDLAVYLHIPLVTFICINKDIVVALAKRTPFRVFIVEQHCVIVVRRIVSRINKGCMDLCVI